MICSEPDRLADFYESTFGFERTGEASITEPAFAALMGIPGATPARLGQLCDLANKRFIQISDDYLLAASKDRDIFEVHYKRRRPLQERLASGIRAVVKGVSGERWQDRIYLSYSDPSARPTDTRRWPPSVQTWTC